MCLCICLGSGRWHEEFSLERSRCRDMRELGLLEGLFGEWKQLQTLSLRFVPLTAACVHMLPNLQELCLTADAVQCSLEAIEAVGACSKLRRLTLTAAPRVCGHSTAFTRPAQRVLQRCSSLEEVALSRITLDHEFFIQLSRCVGGKLRTLRLDKCKWPVGIANAGAQQEARRNTEEGSMARALQGLGALQELEVNNCPPFRDGVLFDLAAVPIRSLQRFALRNVHGIDVGDVALLSMAAAYSDIEDLCITADTNGCNSLSDAFLDALVQPELLPRLQRLCLRGFYSLTSEVVSSVRASRPHLVFQWAQLQPQTA
mmetsp:Transcript_1760/g.6936  ORF Transcript_1760/g.6936 Transcript_1760/m.6936 type:complete len:315 (-) Transcript_1760:43-987(-)